jgi:hypothetical protein
VKRITLAANAIDATLKIQPLPGGHYLVWGIFVSRAWEVDGAGATVWEYRGEYMAREIRSARRLRGGTTLLVGAKLFGGPSAGLFEIDREGHKLWEGFPDDPRLGDHLDNARACLGLVRLGFDPPRKPVLDLDSPLRRATGLRRKNPLTRMRCAATLAILGPKAEPALPALIAALGDPEETVRRAVLDAVVQIGPAALPALLEAARSGDARARAGAAWCLGQLHQQPARTIPALVRLLKDPDPVVQLRAMWAVTNTGPAARDAVPVLTGLLKDTREVRDWSWGAPQKLCEQAAVALERIGPASKAALPVLLDIVPDRDVDMGCRAIRALVRIAPNDPRVLEALLAAIRQKDEPRRRIAAASALAQLGRKARPAVGDLVEALGGAMSEMPS